MIILISSITILFGSLFIVLPDWNTRKLTGDEQSYVDGLINEMKNLATGENEEIVKYLNNLHVERIFLDMENSEDNSDSETRAGRFAGLGKTRTILRNDFFSDEVDNQIKTLLHEAYHAGTKDWTEELSYDWAYTAHAYLFINKEVR